jgi:hypothetical protein
VIERSWYIIKLTEALRSAGYDSCHAFQPTLGTPKG